MMNKMYVFVREDLSPAQRMVQAAHAVAEFLLNVRPKEHQWENGTLVVLGVPDLKTLNEVATGLAFRNIVFENFYEEHFKQITAVATVLKEDQFELFKDFDLVKI